MTSICRLTFDYYQLCAVDNSDIDGAASGPPRHHVVFYLDKIETVKQHLRLE